MCENEEIDSQGKICFVLKQRFILKIAVLNLRENQTTTYANYTNNQPPYLKDMISGELVGQNFVTLSLTQKSFTKTRQRIYLQCNACKYLMK